VFVRKSWNPNVGKKSMQHHIVESYRDPETGTTRHKTLMNITPLPDHVKKAIELSLKRGKTVVGDDVSITTGDILRGAGVLSIHRAWKHQKMDRVLSHLTEAERESVFAMVTQRILDPGSKLSLKDSFSDTLLSRVYSKKRLDEDELYRVMDRLHEGFYDVQERIQQNEDSPALLLYDCTSTYFEGTCAEEGEYGYSRDKRWDRYQVVVGLVCNEQGIPLAVEVWPGSTADKATVCEQIQKLSEEFGIEEAIFVGDKGMYQKTAIEELQGAEYDYILGLQWRKQRKQLESLTPQQLSIFDRRGVVQWQEDGVRYVGCVAGLKRRRAQSRREAGMQRAREQLQRWSETAQKGRYYSWARLREKVNEMLKKEGVHKLWQIDITPLGQVDDPEQKTRLQLDFEPDKEAIKREEFLDGRYVLQTSLDEEKYPAEKVDEHYRSLDRVERAFRHIKSFLQIRPVYHYKRERVRAHILICFLAYYLVKKMELELRQEGFTAEVEPTLRRWDKLRVCQHQVKVGDHKRQDWQWSLGEEGQKIKDEISEVGWWRSLSGYWTSLKKKLMK